MQQPRAIGFTDPPGEALDPLGRAGQPLARSAAMRLVLLGSLVVFAVGCAEKEAADPGQVVREETVNRIAPPSRAASRTVRCGCSDDGLHVSAPPGSAVTVPEDATHDAEAQIVLPADDGAGLPIRRTKSLGFVGDAPLTQIPSRGGPWNAPDGLLPPHAHREPYYGLPRGYSGPSRFVGGYATGYASRGSTPAGGYTTGGSHAAPLSPLLAPPPPAAAGGGRSYGAPSAPSSPPRATYR